MLPIVIQTRQKYFSEKIRLGLYDPLSGCWLDWITFSSVIDISAFDKKLEEYKVLLITCGVIDNEELRLLPFART